MKILKKIIIGIVIVLAGVGIYELSKIYSPGTFPDVETYGFDVKETEMIKVINEFKEQNQKYIPPASLGLEDGRYNPNDYWYRVYFYYPETKEILYVWTRPDNSTSTTLGFVRINKGNELGHWKNINRDFDFSENIAQKKKFNKLILDPIRDIILHREKN